MICVTVDVKIYERNERELEPAEDNTLRVISHWNRPDMVMLQAGTTASTLTVNGNDLIIAIKNAMNTNRFG